MSASQVARTAYSPLCMSSYPFILLNLEVLTFRKSSLISKVQNRFLCLLLLLHGELNEVVRLDFSCHDRQESQGLGRVLASSLGKGQPVVCSVCCLFRMQWISFQGHSGSPEAGITSFGLFFLVFGFKVALADSRARFSAIWVEKYNEALVAGLCLLTVVFAGFIYLFIFLQRHIELLT